MTQLELAMDYLEHCQEEMMYLWKQVVQIETPTNTPAAVDRLSTHLDTYCCALGMETEQLHTEGAGACLAAWTAPRELPPVLLLGHMDTVHPIGSFPGGPFTLRDGCVWGPGVHDCKGGLVIALYAIRALQQAGYRRRQLRLVLAGDEEMAHMPSKGRTVDFLRRHAQGCAAAFTFESGLLSGNVITRRKGGGIIPLTVTGIASHAGTAPEKGASAIREAARKIVAIEDMTDFSTVSFNCGKISGGTSANVIPDRCDVAVSIRFFTNEQCQDGLARLQALCSRVETPGTVCTLGDFAGFPAMEETPKTDALFQIYRDASCALGLGTPETEYSAGCSDSANTTQMGIPTLCAVGVRGTGQHSPQEHALPESLLTQAKRLAAAILALPDDF